MRETQHNLRAPKPVNRLFYFLASTTIRRLIFHFCRLRPKNIRIIPPAGAGILVANHVNVFDPIWIYDVLRRPVHFVASEELFRSRILAPVVRQFGTFAIRKRARDIQSIRNMVKVIRSGGLLGIYPEGTRTWDGISLPILPTIARIIRMMRVPVYSCRVEGGYLQRPRWADRWRPLRVRLVFDRLYPAEAIPESEQQIMKDLAEAIQTRDYELPIPRSNGRRVAGLASGIYRLLYRCPNCGNLESLEAVKPLSSNRVECRSCFAVWEIDLGCRLTPVDDEGTAVGERQIAADFYRRIREMPLKPIHSSLLELEDGEKLYLASRSHFCYREKRYPNLRLLAYGRAFLTDRRFVFKGRGKRKNNVKLAAPLEQIEALNIEPGNKLHFIYRNCLYRIPIHRESPVKWQDYMEQLITRRKRQVDG